MDISAVNDLSFEEFVNIFGNVVEKCPIVAAAVWSERPFQSFTALERAINDFIDLLPQSGTHFFAFEVTFSIVVWCKHNALDTTKSLFCVLVHR